MSNNPWINYHHLYYFKVIATEGSMIEAAKKLRLGQPTLSIQIKQFESILGHELFDRSKRQLQLTDSGKIILDYANEIFKLGHEMLDVLQDRPLDSKIEVQIGAMDSIPKHIMLKIFHCARSSFDCVVAFAEGHGNELLRELRAHRLDLVISNHPPAVGEGVGFFSRLVGKMPVIVCGAKKFVPLRKDFPHSLNQTPFILPNVQSKLRTDIDHYFRSIDIKVDIVAEVQDTSLQKLMATHGDGLVALPSQAAELLIKENQLYKIGVLEDVFEDLWLIAGERRIANPVASQIMKKFCF